MSQNTSTRIDLVGSRLFGDYQVIKKLGEGGMGAVFLAKHDVIDQLVAIKILHRDAVDSHEQVERFNREAHVISLLTHPNIIRVFIFGTSPEGYMYMAMEYVKGRSLAEYYRERGIPDELEAIKIIKQICSAVAEAHDLSIVHRDLKPENVLLTTFRGEEQYVKVLDFGIAKITANSSEPKLTQAGIVYGTPDYIAPEQAMAKDLDSRTDIYALGVMLFEIITGVLPFRRDTVIKLLQAHAFDPPPDPCSVTNRPIADSMRNIILKCLEKDPNNRFQDAMSLYDALELREAEILSKTSGRRTYLPGSEVTRLFSALSNKDLEIYQQAMSDASTLSASSPSSASPVENGELVSPTKSILPRSLEEAVDSKTVIVAVILFALLFILVIVGSILIYLVTTG